MNKKIIALVLIFALALCSVFAAQTTGTSKKNDLSLGVAVGTNTGVAVKYGMGKFDLQGSVGVKFIGDFKFYGDLGAYYNFYDWKFNTGALTKTQTISFSAGPAVAVTLQQGTLGLDAFLAAGAEYTWSDVPITMFLKLGGGCGMVFVKSGATFSPIFYGVLGAVYTF